VRTFRKYLYC